MTPSGRMPILIDDLDDPRVVCFRDVRDADLRGREKLFMAESELVVRRLLASPDRLYALFLSPQKYERLRDALRDLPESVPVYCAKVELMSAIAGFHIHRGVLAAGNRPRAEELTLDRALDHLRQQSSCTLLLAEGMTNVDNMGGLFRNAAAFGVDGVVLDPTCCDPLYRKAIRVSMGHVLSVPYAVSGDWPGDLDRLKKEWGVQLIAAEVIPNARSLWEIPKHEKTAILFGSEGKGLTHKPLKLCDAVGAIPMTATVPSLNVAVASAVFLYELRRDS